MKSIDISSYRTANTCIRFGVSDRTTGTEEFFYIDEVGVISFCLEICNNGIDDDGDGFIDTDDSECCNSNVNRGGVSVVRKN